MEAFQYRNGELHCEGVSLRRLARQHGTPLYVYSLGHILDQYTTLDAAFAGVDHLVCYAMKANSNLAILRALAKRGAGFDVVSAGELYRVVQAGGDPGRCVFSGVGKQRAEIEYALRLGIYAFNIESEPELELVDKVARRMKQAAPVALRVNPHVDPDTHRYISTGKEESKFGISIERAYRVYRDAAQRRGVAIRGVQMHIGSQITKTEPYVIAIKKMLPLVAQVRALSPHTVHSFDIGGGLGIRYHDETPPTARQFAQAVLPHLRECGLKILMEPGRSIVGNAGALVTEVLFVKKTPVKQFLIIDGAMTELIRPALYESYHEVRPVRKQGGKRVKVDVVGPVCESGDFLAQGRRLPAVSAGEYLAVLSAGAYGFTMSSNYNSRPRTAEILVSGRRAAVIRKRESQRDLIRGE